MRLLLLCLLLSPLQFFAQEQVLSDGDRPESEVGAAINPQDQANLIVAAVNDFSPEQGTNGSRIAIYFTQDQGESWTKSSFEAVVDGGGDNTFTADPSVAFDHNGVAYLSYLVWLSGSTGIDARLYVARSTDGGATWTSELIESRTDALIDKPWLTSDLSPASPRYGSVYLTYVLATGTFGDVLRVQARRKSAGADNFGAPVVVSPDNTFIYQRNPTVCVGADGTVFLGFQASFNAGGIGFYTTRSTDGGQTFSTPKRVTYFQFYLNAFSLLPTLDRKGLERLYPCPQLAVDNSDGPHAGRLYASWTDKEEGLLGYGLDAYFSYSDDGGTTWVDGRRLHSDATQLRNQYYANIHVADNGELLAAWYDRRADPGNAVTHYYFARSTDGGQTFIDEAPLTSFPTNFNQINLENDGFGIGEYTSMVSAGGKAFPFWADGRTNNGDIRIYGSTVQFDATSIRIGGDHQLVDFDWQVQQQDRRVWVQLVLPEARPLRFAWVDMTGKVLWQSPLTPYAAQDHRVEVPTDMLPPGSYALRLEAARARAARVVVLP